MRFTYNEIKRLLELGEWGIQKGLTDMDFLSAVGKLKIMVDRNCSSYSIEHRESVLKEKKSKDEFRYLNNVSLEAKQFVIDRVSNGKRNVYHSIMAVINNRADHQTIQPLEEEYRYYLKRAKKHCFEENELQYVREIFEYCYKKVIR